MSIFVSIASYRDALCPSTLSSLFEKAKYPQNIFVGICQQNRDDDMDCANKYMNSPNVRIIRIPYYEARGPTYARYLCSTLWAGEDYFLQIDSHCKFIQDWDIKCISMIKRIKDTNLSKKPIISYYPKELKEYDNFPEKLRTSVPRHCKAFFNNRGMISFMASNTLETNDQFYQVPYIASGFLFCEAYVLNEVKFDPNLPYLFVGEEILHSIRFDTHGWDIFTPTENIVFHEYLRHNDPKIWTDNPSYNDTAAFNKVKKIIGLHDTELEKEVNYNLVKYGLGDVRTLQDYYNFSKIDIKNKRVYSNFCRPNNEATEDDILNSNEVKKLSFLLEEEGYTHYHTFYHEKYQLLFYSFMVFVFFLFCLHITK